MQNKQIKLGRFRQKQQHEKAGQKSITQGKSTDIKRFANANLKIT